MLDLAARAPSPDNTQPWNVTVVRRETIRDIERTLTADLGNQEPTTPFESVRSVEPYASRQAQWERQLFGLMKIDPTDNTARRRIQAKRFGFFDAPVGLFVSVDRRLGQDALVAAGMFAQTLVLAAESYGMASSIQFVFSNRERSLRPIISLPEHDVVACAIALGYLEASAPENWLRSARVSQEEWVRTIPSARRGAPSSSARVCQDSTFRNDDHPDVNPAGATVIDRFARYGSDCLERIAGGDGAVGAPTGCGGGSVE